MVSAKEDKTASALEAGSSSDRAGGTNVGEALRAVYREAVAESVPDEMLDLLNKLG